MPHAPAQAPQAVRHLEIPRVVADWAQCTWLYDNLVCVTTSAMQRAVARELRALGAPPARVTAVQLTDSQERFHICQRQSSRCNRSSREQSHSMTCWSFHWFMLTGVVL